jgi:hypothetical protein
MRLRPLALAFIAAFAVSPVAWAQLQLTSSGGQSLETMSVGAGRSLTFKGLASGLKLGESAILHAGLFADLGYDSNVFYGGNGAGQDAKPAPILLITPRLEISNAERNGSIPSGTYYDISASIGFRKYLSNDDTVTQQDGISPSVGGTVEFSSAQALSFALSESFSRFQQAPYQPGKPIIRDANMASANLRFAPGGGRLRVMLRYTNLIDKYEGSFDGGSNMGNEFVLDIGWRWLPRTTLFVQAAQGVVTYFNSRSAQSSSYPLRTLAGIRGLLTEKLGVNLATGYSNAFYSSGDSPTGFGNLGIVAELNYTMNALSKAGIGYHHDFANSPFIGSFYNMDAIYAAYQQMVASRVVTYLYGRYENRRYGVVIDQTDNTEIRRADNYIVGGVSLDYSIRNIVLVGASYSLAFNRSSITTGPAAGVDFTKHLLMFRLGVVY